MPTFASAALTYDGNGKSTDGKSVENLWKNRCGQGLLNAFVSRFYTSLVSLKCPFGLQKE